MTSSTDPAAIRAEIERIQAGIGRDVDRLTEKVNPHRVLERRLDQARDRAGRWKDAVMGAAPDTSPGEAASAVAGRVGDTLSGAADTVQEAPRAVVRQARGNPVAAGLIAFGAGWLVSSLLPSTRPEQRLAEQARDRAGEPVAEQARQVATQLRDGLAAPAEEAAGALRDAATDAGRALVDEGGAAAQHVRDRAADAASTAPTARPGGG